MVMYALDDILVSIISRLLYLKSCWRNIRIIVYRITEYRYDLYSYVLRVNTATISKSEKLLKSKIILLVHS
jgi:hypothetical protein